jgi:tellurite resistance protein TerC
VLFWGILGALVMRGLMIGLGVELVQHYQWMFYVFGVFLVLTGIRMVLAEEEELEPSKNPVVRLASRYFPVSAHYDGPRFFTLLDGRRALTPLALVILMVETTDLVFALDSIPAILGVTTQPFIVFTSNVFAILGLRSLYFVLAGAIAYFRYLKVGLAMVLVFIGFKMLIADWYKISSKWSLIVVTTVILGAILWSLMVTRRQPTEGDAGNTVNPRSPGSAGRDGDSQA